MNSLIIIEDDNKIIDFIEYILSILICNKNFIFPLNKSIISEIYNFYIKNNFTMIENFEDFENGNINKNFLSKYIIDILKNIYIKKWPYILESILLNFFNKFLISNFIFDYNLSNCVMNNLIFFYTEENLKHLKNLLIKKEFINEDIHNAIFNRDFNLDNIDYFIFLLKQIRFQKLEYYKEIIKKYKIKDKDLNEYIEKQYNNFIDLNKNLFIDFLVLNFCLYFIKKNEQKEFRLCSTKILYNKVLSIFPCLNVVNYIKKISLSKNQGKGIMLYEISLNLQINKNIEEINFSNCKIDTNDLYFFYEAIENNVISQITEINLQENNLEKNSVFILSLLLNKLPNLKSLNLSYNNLINLKIFFVNLLNLYKNNKSILENLYLINTNLNYESIYELINIIKLKKCKLKILCLNKININNIAGKKFLNNLKYNDSLQELYLFECDINNSSVYYIKNLLIKCSIYKLDLLNNNISIFKNIIKLFSKTQIININKNNCYYPTLFSLNLTNNHKKEYENCDIKLLNQINKNSGLITNAFLNIINSTNLRNIQRGSELQKFIDILYNNVNSI